VAKLNYTGQDGAEVKPWKGIWAAGQGLGCINKVQPVAQLVDDLVAEYSTASKRIKAICNL